MASWARSMGLVLFTFVGAVATSYAVAHALGAGDIAWLIGATAGGLVVVLIGRLTQAGRESATRGRSEDTSHR